MMDKPPVVREWRYGAWVEACHVDEHNAAIQYLQAELRSRPTREEFEQAKRDLNNYVTDSERDIAELEAKLAAIEAERGRLRKTLIMIGDRSNDPWMNGVVRDALAPVAGSEEGGGGGQGPY